MLVTKLDDIISLAKSKTNKRLAVVFVNDTLTLKAVNEAVENGIIDATLTGQKEVINKLCDELNISINKFDIIEQSDPTEAGLLCCDLINEGKAHLIMKGSITTDEYMRCILNKERGLLPPNSLMTHATVMEPPGAGKLLIIGDVAIIPAPTVDQKEKILLYLLDIARKLEIKQPKVALIAPSEKPSKKIQSSADAMELVERAAKGIFGDSIIAGPMGFDLAIDKEAVKIKGYESPVGGNADIILFPNLESGNVFYKTMTKFVHAEAAAIILGGKVPAILSSRGDTPKSKLYSIALAAVTTDL